MATYLVVLPNGRLEQVIRYKAPIHAPSAFQSEIAKGKSIWRFDGCQELQEASIERICGHAHVQFGKLAVDDAEAVRADAAAEQVLKNESALVEAITRETALRKAVDLLGIHATADLRRGLAFWTDRVQALFSVATGQIPMDPVVLHPDLAAVAGKSLPITQEA